MTEITITEETMIYFVRAGRRPHMREAFLVDQNGLEYIVRNREGAPHYPIRKINLERARITVTQDRTHAVATLLANLQATKAQSEARVSRIDRLIKEIIDKEGL